MPSLNTGHLTGLWHLPELGGRMIHQSKLEILAFSFEARASHVGTVTSSAVLFDHERAVPKPGLLRAPAGRPLSPGRAQRRTPAAPFSVPPSLTPARTGARTRATPATGPSLAIPLRAAMAPGAADALRAADHGDLICQTDAGSGNGQSVR